MAVVGYLAQRGYFDAPRVHHVIIPEPLDVDCVCLGHRGVWWAEVEVKGRIGHGSMPFLGVSAIRGMGDFIALIEEELYPLLDQRRTAMPCEPLGARAATLNFNSIHGGLGEGYSGLPAPVVADSCRLVLDRRYLIEEDFPSVKAEIIALLDKMKSRRPGLDYSLRELMTFQPTMTPPDAEVVTTLDHWIQQILQRPAPPYCLARHLRPETHHALWAGARLRRLWSRHSGAGAPAGRICRYRRYDRIGEDHGRRRFELDGNPHPRLNAIPRSTGTPYGLQSRGGGKRRQEKCGLNYRVAAVIGASLLSDRCAGQVALAASDAVTICQTLEPPVLDPTAAPRRRQAIREVTYGNIFEGLLAINSSKGELYPKLATGWDIAFDNKTYTFHLRPGVRRVLRRLGLHLGRRQIHLRACRRCRQQERAEMDLHPDCLDRDAGPADREDHAEGRQFEIPVRPRLG